VHYASYNLIRWHSKEWAVSSIINFLCYYDTICAIFVGKERWTPLKHGLLTKLIDLWGKGSLFCFVMLGAPESPWCFMSCSWYFQKALDELGAPTWFETVWSYGVKVYWLLNHFLKIVKIKTEKCIGIWGRSWCCWKALGESNLIEFISQFLKLMCERYWFLQKLQKLGLEGKISWALNVFTLWPTAQARLVMDEMKMRMSKNLKKICLNRM
jgi:hypothetical protein